MGIRILPIGLSMHGNKKRSKIVAELWGFPVCKEFSNKLSTFPLFFFNSKKVFLLNRS
jgi:hypothetical protein